MEVKEETTAAEREVIEMEEGSEEESEEKFPIAGIWQVKGAQGPVT